MVKSGKKKERKKEEKRKRSCCCLIDEYCAMQINPFHKNITCHSYPLKTIKKEVPASQENPNGTNYNL